tara:strand:+ start:93 stop:386 length:294 start_codon:yes stop_codon:yes gene_type:complete
MNKINKMKNKFNLWIVTLVDGTTEYGFCEDYNNDKVIKFNDDVSSSLAEQVWNSKSNEKVIVSKLVEMENDLNENRNCPFAKGIISYKDLNLEMVGA